ncbi:MAG TPA: hypothetical protein VKV73_22865 [Chloroflexota bacterium]|nr:hypothetical protein [Chloroflexota bacterium]
MNRVPPRAPISRVERLGVLLVPWAFIALFCGLYLEFLVPRVRDGHLLAVGVGVFVTFVLIVCFTAAVTFSRDVLTGRWP